MSMKGNARLSSARTLASLLLISSLAVMGGSTAFAGQILGFGLGTGSGHDGPIYSIDAVTGNAVEVEPFGVSRVSGASPSSVPGQFFFVCLGCINLHIEDLFGNFNDFGALTHGWVDLAYDADTGTLYGVDPTGLYRIDPNYCPPVLFFACSTTLVAVLPPGIDGIDFVSGAGIYGVSNLDGFLYRIDPHTGTVMAVGPTDIPTGDGVADLAYDAETGALVASVLPGVLDKYSLFDFSILQVVNVPPFGMLYRIDPNTGVATLLNGHAPVMLGLAENDVPEPSTGVLLLSAIAALSLARRFSRRGSCVYRFRRRMASSV
jgi:hypothetical protein